MAVLEGGRDTHGEIETTKDRDDGRGWEEEERFSYIATTALSPCVYHPVSGTFCMYPTCRHPHVSRAQGRQGLGDFGRFTLDWTIVSSMSYEISRKRRRRLLRCDLCDQRISELVRAQSDTSKDTPVALEQDYGLYNEVTKTHIFEA